MKKMLLALLACGAFGYALAHQQTGDDRVDYRQGAYRIMGWQMGILGDMARGEKPFDHKRAQEAARNLQWAERLTATTYSPETKGAKKTRLRQKAWNEMETFADRGRSLKAQIDLLLMALEAGDEAKTKEYTGSVGKACKACHDDYVEKMRH